MARRTFTVDTRKAGLNLRAEPNLEAEILRLIPNGGKVVLDPEKESPEAWAAVKGGGYVMREFLK